MTTHWFMSWMLVIVASALAGWWLAVRPRASYRGVATPVSFLIVVAAVLMCMLALSGQPHHRGHRLPSGSSTVSLAR